MNIKNTMCRLSDLTQEQVNSLVAEMPNSDLFDFVSGEPYIGVRPTGAWGTWRGNNNPKIVTYTEMMQLLGKTLKNPLEIEIGDTVKISNKSGHYGCGSSNPMSEGISIAPKDEDWPYCVLWPDGQTNSYKSHDLILIKKGKTMKEFTKSDLKAGVHFVKDRDGVFYAVCRNAFCELNGFVALSCFNDELVNVNGNNEMDIIEVYETDKDRSMTSYLKGLGLKRIWERTEQTPAQKEMEVLQIKMNESQAKMNELQAQMKVVQAKL